MGWFHLYSNRRNLYSRIFGNLSSVEDILTRIEWEGKNAPVDKWMTLPELGYIIATAYNIVFVSYGVHVRHFIALHMFDGNDYPLPGMAWNWEQEHDPSATNLIAPYTTGKCSKNDGGNRCFPSFLGSKMTKNDGFSPS